MTRTSNHYSNTTPCSYGKWSSSPKTVKISPSHTAGAPVVKPECSLIWTNYERNAPEPEDVLQAPHYNNVGPGRATGVFLIKITSPQLRLYYWILEQNAEGDLCLFWKRILNSGKGHTWSENCIPALSVGLRCQRSHICSKIRSVLKQLTLHSRG